MEYAELELTLHRRDSQSYALELRFSQPDSDSDIRLLRDDSGPVEFDDARLGELALEPGEYGRALGASLLADPAVRDAFAKARAGAQSLDAALRLRLFIGSNAAELHSLRWETLCDPADGSALLMGEHVLFSRYLSSGDWRPVKLRPKGALRALVVIANPADLGSYKLAAVDVQGELARAQASLGAIPATALFGGGANLNNLITQLRDGYDILYLVCHGALVKGEPWLWLEDEQGNVARAAGAELVARLQGLAQRPRLIVLASCQSAGTGDDARTADASGALAALGPRLAEAGIPAVIAMQGQVSMATVARFMPAFFQELQRDGQIDRAVAVARDAVRDRDDAWMPVLFMRLKSGRIWYVPGFGDDRKGFEKWPALIRSMRQGRCTPIIGAGLIDPLIGTSHDLAQRWADSFDFPMDPHEREDLPQVAQYVAVNQDEQFVRDELAQFIRQELRLRYRDILPDSMADAPLSELLTTVGAAWRERDAAAPHRVLASQPFPIYITTTPDSLLEAALEAAGKTPRVALCPWNEYVERSQAVYEEEPDAQHPLVYHLFGSLAEPDSLVLTEDDYFNYLIGVTGNKELIPNSVRRALADTALLFLGFRIEDWNFRVLFRSFMNQEGRGRRRKYTHVAAQIDPEEGRIQEPERARRYLESYFQDADISIYWGSTDDFMRELADKLATTR